MDRSRLMSLIQTGRLRRYALALVLGTSLLALGGYAAAGISLPALAAEGMTAAIAIVLAVAVVGGLAVVAANSHIAGVLTLSILGFMVAIFYILAAAPDLALTQLVVETLVLVIFLLVLDKLPAFYGSINRWRAVGDALVAGVVGITVAVTVLVATAQDPADPIAPFIIEHAGVPDDHGFLLLDAGGGNNIVNVILVDFRALDTLGEISVIALAALSVVTMIGLRNGGDGG